jgi:hypothetical protein
MALEASGIERHRRANSAAVGEPHLKLRRSLSLAKQGPILLSFLLQADRNRTLDARPGEETQSLRPGSPSRNRRRPLNVDPNHSRDRQQKARRSSPEQHVSGGASLLYLTYPRLCLPLISSAASIGIMLTWPPPDCGRLECCKMRSTVDCVSKSGTNAPSGFDDGSRQRWRQSRSLEEMVPALGPSAIRSSASVATSEGRRRIQELEIAQQSHLCGGDRVHFWRLSKLDEGS